MSEADITNQITTKTIAALTSERVPSNRPTMQAIGRSVMSFDGALGLGSTQFSLVQSWHGGEGASFISNFVRMHVFHLGLLPVRRTLSVHEVRTFRQALPYEEAAYHSRISSMRSGC